MTKRKAKKVTQPTAAKPYVCKYCNKGFVRESSIISHMCEQKRRFTIKDEKYVVMGFMTFKKFNAMNYSRDVDYEDFAGNQFYSAFIKFGRHMLNINAIDPSEFIKFVLSTALPIDHWCRDDTYEAYVRYLTSKEPSTRALERNILIMEQWGLEHNESWIDFFRKVAPSYAVQLIRSGRLSPWVLYNCASANNLLGRFTEEQIVLVKEYINPGVWSTKFKKHIDEVNFIKEISKETGF